VNFEKVIIVGAGPAGLATALQLERFGIKPLVVEKDLVGGLLHNANLVENYPGFPGGIPGPQLVELFKDQVREYHINFLEGKVEQLDYTKGRFELLVNGQTLYCEVAVIASGTKPRAFTDFDTPSEIQDKLFYEVYPLLDEKGKDIAIVGAGDAAFDYAINLARNNNVVILNRGSKISCLPLLKERAAKIQRIEYWPDTHITHVTSSTDKRIMINCVTPERLREYSVDFLIGAIGREANTKFISGQIAKKTIQLENSGKLYFVGDVVNGIYRQTAIAVGNGILAAMKIHMYFKENNK
jgi:thioredoxin reductase (NADPH)